MVCYISMSDTELQCSIFLVRLSMDQKIFINTILPKTYSLQRDHMLHINSFQNIHHQKFNILQTQDINKDKQSTKIKRKKIKIYQEFQDDDKKISINKKQSIAKKALILKKLKKHDSSWPFRIINETKIINNSTHVVNTPMDLQMIQDKIKNDKYQHPSQIQRDVNQILLNSYKSNYKNNEYFEATLKFEQYYNNLLHENQQLYQKNEQNEKNKKKQNLSNDNIQQQKTNNQVAQYQKDINTLQKKANQLSTQKQVRQKPIYISSKLDGNISIKQKKQLVQEIKTIDQRHLGRILEIIKCTAKDGHEFKIDDKTEMLSLDLEKLDNRTVRELQNYIKLQKNSMGHQREQSFVDSHENQYSVC